jgi:hypothetical protein
MANELSPQAEQYLSSVVADGLFPSKESALEAAVEALHAARESVPMVPSEHMELVEQGILSARAGRSRALTDADWQHLRQCAENAAAKIPPGGV